MKSFEIKISKRNAIRHAIALRITDAKPVRDLDMPRNINSSVLVELIKDNKIQSVCVCSWAGCSWIGVNNDEQGETL
jgi:predicted RNA-binding Zn ribbon-like protein